MDEFDHQINFNSLKKYATSLSMAIAIMDESNRQINFNSFKKSATSLLAVIRVWQNHLRNEGSVFQDPDRVILDEARMHVNTHTKHLKP
jgi:hypothetical protein